MKTQNIVLIVFLLLTGCVPPRVMECFETQDYYVHYINRTHADMTFYVDTACAKRRCDTLYYIHIPKGDTLKGLVSHIHNNIIGYNSFYYSQPAVDKNGDPYYRTGRIHAIAKIGDKQVVYIQARTPTYIRLPEEQRGNCKEPPYIYIKEVGDTSIFARYTYTPYSIPKYVSLSKYETYTINGAIEYIFRSSDTLHYKKK